MDFKNNLWFMIMPAALLSGLCVGSIAAAQSDNSTLFMTASESFASTTFMADSFLKALRQNAGTVALLCIFGTSLFGGIPSAVLLAMRGYGLGQTVGALVSVFGFRGFLAAVGGIFPHNLFYVPFLCFSAIISARFAGRLFCHTQHFKRQILTYLLSIVLLFLPIFLGCLIEGYISAPLLKNILSAVL